MHSVELDKKLRLPDPSKAIEGAWKLLKRTRQQLNITSGKTPSVSGVSGHPLSEKKRAKIEADRQKGRGTQYFLRTTVR